MDSPAAKPDTTGSPTAKSVRLDADGNELINPRTKKPYQRRKGGGCKRKGVVTARFPRGSVATPPNTRSAVNS